MYANDAALLNGGQMRSVEVRPRGRGFVQAQAALSLALKTRGSHARIEAWMLRSHGETCWIRFGCMTMLSVDSVDQSIAARCQPAIAKTFKAIAMTSAFNPRNAVMSLNSWFINSCWQA